MKNKNLLTRKGNRHHHTFFLAAALFLVLSFSHNASATMIGDWDVQSAPISASMNGINNGFINAWLNTTYTPITIQDALATRQAVADREIGHHEIILAGGVRCSRLTLDLLVQYGGARRRRVGDICHRHRD